MNPPPKFTLRVRFSVEGKVRFVSHRDTARIMERAFRKLGLPVAYSEGFSPRPRFSFGLALSVAHESEAEYLDVDLVTPVDIEDLPTRLTDALPDGFAVSAVGWLEPGKASLQQAISCCHWRIETLGATVPDVTAAVSKLLDAPELMLERERKGKTTVVDVRPAILDVEVLGPTNDGVQCATTLATQPVALRPSEFVRVLSPELSEGRVRRIHQFTIVDGERFEPLEAPDPSASHSSPPAKRAALAGQGCGP